MCVSFPFVLDARLVDVPAGVTQEEGYTGFLIHLSSAVLPLIRLSRRIQPFLSLVDRDFEFCVLTIKSFSTCWAFLLFIYFYEEKSQLPGFELTSQRVKTFRGYQLNHRGDRILNEIFPRNEGKRRLKPPATTIIIDFWSTGSLVKVLDRHCPLSVCDRAQVTITTADQNLSRI